MVKVTADSLKLMHIFPLSRPLTTPPRSITLLLRGNENGECRIIQAHAHHLRLPRDLSRPPPPLARSRARGAKTQIRAGQVHFRASAPAGNAAESVNRASGAGGGGGQARPGTVHHQRALQ